jgi:hypothetical protein
VQDSKRRKSGLNLFRDIRRKRGEEMRRYKEIRVCGKCLGEYTEEEALHEGLTEASYQDISPCCKEAGFYLILERNGMRYLQSELAKKMFQKEVKIEAIRVSDKKWIITNKKFMIL